MKGGRGRGAITESGREYREGQGGAGREGGRVLPFTVPVSRVQGGRLDSRAV